MANPSRITDFSVTASNNTPSGTDTIGSNADDLIRAIQATIRGDLAHKGSDITSATTTDLGAVQGLFHDITGTTTITGLGTVAAGVWKVIKFEGALTLTHNATSLILPGGGNITTANGDIAIVVSEGSGNWRCVLYLGANLLPQAATNAEVLAGTNTVKVVTPSALDASRGMVKLASGAVDDDATLDIDMTSYTSWRNKLLVLDSFLPATDGAALIGRVSTDGGSNFDAGAGAYRYCRRSITSDSTVSDAGGTDNQIVISTGVGNQAGEGVSGRVTMFDTTSARNGQFLTESVANNGAPATVLQSHAVERLASQNTDAFRVMFSSGNITSGNWVLYGYNE